MGSSMAWTKGYLGLIFFIFPGEQEELASWMLGLRKYLICLGRFLWLLMEMHGCMALDRPSLGEAAAAAARDTQFSTRKSHRHAKTGRKQDLKGWIWTPRPQNAVRRRTRDTHTRAASMVLPRWMPAQCCKTSAL